MSMNLVPNALEHDTINAEAVEDCTAGPFLHTIGQSSTQF